MNWQHVKERWREWCALAGECLRRHHVQQLFTTLGAGGGLVALVWVAYLHGLQVGSARRSPEPAPPVALEITPLPDELVIAAAPDGEPPHEPIPEVWTRIAGLNVWIAGRRQVHGLKESRLVVVLHGYGRPRGMLLGLAERDASRHGTAILFPEAPIALDARRRAWWRPEPFSNHRANGPHEGVVAARNQVLALLGEIERRFGVPLGDVVLAGFSQGGTLAFDVVLHLPESIGGLALLSAKGLDAQLVQGPIPGLGNSPILIAHGRSDPMASFDAANRLQKTLVQFGHEVTWVPYPGGHEVSWMAQEQLSRFIARVISPSATDVTSGTSISDRQP